MHASRIEHAPKADDHESHRSDRQKRHDAQRSIEHWHLNQRSAGLWRRGQSRGQQARVRAVHDQQANHTEQDDASALQSFAELPAWTVARRLVLFGQGRQFRPIARLRIEIVRRQHL